MLYMCYFVYIGFAAFALRSFEEIVMQQILLRLLLCDGRQLAGISRCMQILVPPHFGQHHLIIFDLKFGQQLDHSL